MAKYFVEIIAYSFTSFTKKKTKNVNDVKERLITTAKAKTVALLSTWTLGQESDEGHCEQDVKKDFISKFYYFFLICRALRTLGM